MTSVVRPFFFFSQLFLIFLSMTEESEIQTDQEHGCTQCQAISAKQARHEELTFALLLALVPAITLSFFGTIGLL